MKSGSREKNERRFERSLCCGCMECEIILFANFSHADKCEPCNVLENLSVRMKVTRLITDSRRRKMFKSCRSRPSKIMEKPVKKIRFKILHTSFLCFKANQSKSNQCFRES